VVRVTPTCCAVSVIDAPSRTASAAEIRRNNSEAEHIINFDNIV
jgi:hypothetical protein